MKKGFNILLILCAALVAISCSKTKSYTDMLKDEKKAIERFIDDKGLEILDDFPADSTGFKFVPTPHAAKNTSISGSSACTLS